MSLSPGAAHLTLNRVRTTPLTYCRGPGISIYFAPDFTWGFLFSRRRHGDVVIPAKAGIQTFSISICNFAIYILTFNFLNLVFLSNSLISNSLIHYLLSSLNTRPNHS